MSPILIIGAGEPNDKASIPLSTKKGKHIPNEQKPGRSPQALKEAETIWKQKFPSIRTRSLSATYNCVGLVFGSRRTCIDPTHINMILQDDEYRKLSGDGEVQPGDLVLYKKDREYEHIGVVIQVEPDVANSSFKMTVLSQWGQDGEYLHLVEEVPDNFGRTWEFWTERKVLK